MTILKSALTIFGVLLLAMGLLWIGQGLDIIRWPASSFMIADINWSWRGAALAGVGAALIWFVRRQ